MKIDRKRLLEIHEEMCEEAREIMERKNHDYATDEKSPFDNFEVCERVGICQTELGFLTRMMDKFKRIITFVKRGTLMVKNESVKDACIDLINYLILFWAYQRSLEDAKEDEKLNPDFN